MQLEGGPCNPNQALALQLFDPNRVDVAPGSNVVREDDQVDGLLSHLDLGTLFSRYRFLPRRLTLGWQYEIAQHTWVRRH
jgi:hypothetical protein